MQAMSDNLYANKHDFSDYARLYTHTVRLTWTAGHETTQTATAPFATAVCVEKNCAETRRAEANCAETGPALQDRSSTLRLQHCDGYRQWTVSFFKHMLTQQQYGNSMMQSLLIGLVHVYKYKDLTECWIASNCRCWWRLLLVNDLCVICSLQLW